MTTHDILIFLAGAAFGAIALIAVVWFALNVLDDFWCDEDDGWP